MKISLRSVGVIALSAMISTTVYAQTSKLDEVAAPITHPTSFEDPRPYTEIRPIYIYHKISDDFVTKGGAANVYAMQLRYAVDDRLGIIATKDGYVDLNTDEVLPDQSGFADLAVGAKYAFYRDDVNGRIASFGLRYEIPVGEEEIFQGQEKGAFNPFVSVAYAVGPVNMMVGTGFRLAVNGNDSSFYDLDLHFDTKVGSFHPVLEFNVYNVIDAGNRLPIPDEGEDFFNFGSSLSEGKTLVSSAVGGRFDLTDSISWGFAYQFPLNGDRAGSNILDYRITTDLIFKFC